MDNSISYTNGKIWLSKEWLIEQGVQIETIKKWITRSACSYDGKSFQYDTLPEPTRKKLPSIEELKPLATNTKTVLLYSRIYQASRKTVGRYIKEVKAYTGADTELVHKFAHRAAALDEALQINTCSNGMLVSMFEAFQKLFPGWRFRLNRSPNSA